MDFSAAHIEAGSMSCRIQTGFPEVSKGTAGSVLELRQANNRSAWKQQIWSVAKLLLVLLATLAAAELFGKLFRFEMQFHILTLISLLCLSPHKQSCCYYYYLSSGSLWHSSKLIIAVLSVLGCCFCAATFVFVYWINRFFQCKMKEKWIFLRMLSYLLLELWDKALVLILCVFTMHFSPLNQTNTVKGFWAPVFYLTS